ncbi:hypothetical protein AY599_21310 [Leptolyngbya valderiana BDU 20041]|nr:hypothetical protein AY599_21310 [Leptolyngbya valderiana BDU 20041]PPT05781.1 Flavodoxin reductases (ferredoxin-NADPH reductases) family 1 [Geitlerinema sp. FC II]
MQPIEIESAMTVALATPLSQIELIPGSAIRVSGVSWESYIVLLQELGEHRATRIAYNDGVLEIRMPGAFHEIVNRVLAAIVLVLAEELGLELNNLGSTRFDSPDFSKGIEPDSCFYIQHARVAQGLDGEMSSKVPPDLAVEVDIAHRSQSKLPIYSAIAVPELWLYRQDALSILALQGGQYREISTSLAFPSVSVVQLNQWVQLRKTGTDLTVVRAVRAFCRDRSTSP